MRKKTLMRGTVEKASPGDIDDIILIEKEGSPHPWKRSFFEGELLDKLSSFLIFRGSEKGEVEGFLIFRKIRDIIEINNIAVRVRSRKMGIAGSLMRTLIDAADMELVISIFLEVRVSNDVAVSFYKKFNFKKAGVRKNYYKNPVEDALIFEMKITKT